MLLKEYWEELEADFQEVYRLDLLGFFTGTLSPTKTLRLLIGLPSNSRFQRKISPAAEWEPDTYLLAQIADAIAGGNWQRGGGKGPKPKPVPRPGSKQKTTYGKTTLSQSQIKDYLKRLKEGRAKERPINGD